MIETTELNRPSGRLALLKGEQVPLEQVPLEQVPLEQVPLEQVHLEQVPLEQVPLEQVQLEQISLEQVPLLLRSSGVVGEGSWERHSPLEF